MAKRKKDTKADIKIRLTEGLRSKIERSAKSRGVSMNADMIERIERSFGQEDEFGGGAEWRQFVHLMSSAFSIAGRNKADEKSFSGDWTRDADCYAAAVVGVVEALALGMPRTPATMEYVEALAASVKGRITTPLIKKGGA